MAKKKKKESVAKNIFGAGLGALSNVLFSTVFTKVEEEADFLLDKAKTKVDEAIHKAEYRAHILLDRLIKELTTGAITALGAIFLLSAAFFLMIESGYPQSKAALYIGAGLLLIGFFLKYKYLKEEQRR